MRAVSLRASRRAAQQGTDLGLGRGGSHNLLSGLLNLCAGLLAVVAVHLQQLGQVKLGGAQDLHLPDGCVLQRVDALSRLLNLLACTPTLTI